MSAAYLAIRDQLYRMGRRMMSRDTVGTTQSAQSLTHMLEPVVYQRPALTLHAEIITLQGFAIGMLIMGRKPDTIIYAGQRGSLTYLHKYRLSY